MKWQGVIWSEAKWTTNISLHHFFPPDFTRPSRNTSRETHLNPERNSKSNIFMIITELIFFTFFPFILPLLSIFVASTHIMCCKISSSFLIETINYLSISGFKMLFIARNIYSPANTGIINAKTVISSSQAPFSQFHFLSSFLYHCLHFPFNWINFARFVLSLQLNSLLRMDCLADCAPHIQTFNYWNLRRNFIIINIYVDHDVSKLQPV